MGFTPSATWAKMFNDVVAEDIALPQDRRIVAESIVPPTLPVWGSIEDNFWVVEEETEAREDIVGPVWLSSVVQCWRELGVECNTKKGRRRSSRR